jgi:hypothetical protein
MPNAIAVHRSVLGAWRRGDAAEVEAKAEHEKAHRVRVGRIEAGARVSLSDRHTVFRACARVPPIPEGRQQHMQHMMAEERIIGRRCEVSLTQHRRGQGRLSRCAMHCARCATTSGGRCFPRPFRLHALTTSRLHDRSRLCASGRSRQREDQEHDVGAAESTPHRAQHADKLALSSARCHHRAQR